VPLTLAAAGLVVTFAGGLWNIGVEGQIVAGAVVATWVAREVPGPDTVLISGCSPGSWGAVWALLAGVLKTRGGVNGFGGLGLTSSPRARATPIIGHKSGGRGVHERHRPVPSRGLMPTAGVAQVPVVPIALTVVAWSLHAPMRGRGSACG
jgi:ABC-type uncharacterized transport system permease subunit